MITNQNKNSSTSLKQHSPLQRDLKKTRKRILYGFIAGSFLLVVLIIVVVIFKIYFPKSFSRRTASSPNKSTSLKLSSESPGGGGGGGGGAGGGGSPDGGKNNGPPGNDGLSAIDIKDLIADEGASSGSLISVGNQKVTVVRAKNEKNKRIRLENLDLTSSYSTAIIEQLDDSPAATTIRNAYQIVQNAIQRGTQLTDEERRIVQQAIDLGVAAEPLQPLLNTKTLMKPLEDAFLNALNAFVDNPTESMKCTLETAFKNLNDVAEDKRDVQNCTFTSQWSTLDAAVVPISTDILRARMIKAFNEGRLIIAEKLFLALKALNPDALEFQTSWTEYRTQLDSVCKYERRKRDIIDNRLKTLIVNISFDPEDIHVKNALSEWVQARQELGADRSDPSSPEALLSDTSQLLLVKAIKYFDRDIRNLILSSGSQAYYQKVCIADPLFAGHFKTGQLSLPEEFRTFLLVEMKWYDLLDDIEIHGHRLNFLDSNDINFLTEIKSLVPQRSKFLPLIASVIENAEVILEVKAMLDGSQVADLGKLNVVRSLSHLLAPICNLQVNNKIRSLTRTTSEALTTDTASRTNETETHDSTSTDIGPPISVASEITTNETNIGEVNTITSRSDSESSDRTELIGEITTINGRGLSDKEAQVIASTKAVNSMIDKMCKSLDLTDRMLLPLTQLMTQLKQQIGQLTYVGRDEMRNDVGCKQLPMLMKVLTDFITDKDKSESVMLCDYLIDAIKDCGARENYFGAWRLYDIMSHFHPTGAPQFDWHMISHAGVRQYLFHNYYDLLYSDLSDWTIVDISNRINSTTLRTYKQHVTLGQLSLTSYEPALTTTLVIKHALIFWWPVLKALLKMRAIQYKGSPADLDKVAIWWKKIFGLHDSLSLPAETDETVKNIQNGTSLNSLANQSWRTVYDNEFKPTLLAFMDEYSEVVPFNIPTVGSDHFPWSELSNWFSCQYLPKIDPALQGPFPPGVEKDFFKEAAIEYWAKDKIAKLIEFAKLNPLPKLQLEKYPNPIMNKALQKELKKVIMGNDIKDSIFVLSKDHSKAVELKNLLSALKNTPETDPAIKWKANKMIALNDKLSAIPDAQRNRTITEIIQKDDTNPCTSSYNILDRALNVLAINSTAMIVDFIKRLVSDATIRASLSISHPSTNAFRNEHWAEFNRCVARIRSCGSGQFTLQQDLIDLSKFETPLLNIGAANLFMDDTVGGCLLLPENRMKYVLNDQINTFGNDFYIITNWIQLVSNANESDFQRFEQYLASRAIFKTLPSVDAAFVDVASKYLDVQKALNALKLKIIPALPNESLKTLANSLLNNSNPKFAEFLVAFQDENLTKTSFFSFYEQLLRMKVRYEDSINANRSKLPSTQDSSSEHNRLLAFKRASNFLFLTELLTATQEAKPILFKVLNEDPNEETSLLRDYGDHDFFVYVQYWWKLKLWTEPQEQKLDTTIINEDQKTLWIETKRNHWKLKELVQSFNSHEESSFKMLSDYINHRYRLPHMRRECKIDFDPPNEPENLSIFVRENSYVEWATGVIKERANYLKVKSTSLDTLPIDLKVHIKAFLDGTVANDTIVAKTHKALLNYGSNFTILVHGWTDSLVQLFYAEDRIKEIFGVVHELKPSHTDEKQHQLLEMLAKLLSMRTHGIEQGYLLDVVVDFIESDRITYADGIQPPTVMPNSDEMEISIGMTNGQLFKRRYRLLNLINFLPKYASDIIQLKTDRRAIDLGGQLTLKKWCDDSDAGSPTLKQILVDFLQTGPKSNAQCVAHLKSIVDLLPQTPNYLLARAKLYFYHQVMQGHLKPK